MGSFELLTDKDALDILSSKTQFKSNTERQTVNLYKTILDSRSR
jgi:hypothetical protein